MRLIVCLTLFISPLVANPCTVYPQGRADCRHRGLQDIPSSLPQNTQHLDLSNNFIHFTKPLEENFPELRLLNLSHNPLKSLPNNSFQNLPKLQTLDLSDCGISTLHLNILSGLDSLETLILSHNNLSRISLGNLKSLRSLDIRKTSLIFHPSHPKIWDLEQLSVNNGLCECPSEEPKREAVSGLFCSCRLRIEESQEHRLSARFVRDVIENITNDTSSNLTSPSPVTPVSNGRSWPYFVGFVLVAIFLSCIIALAAKFSILRKYLRSYRHRPLPENEWVSETQSEVPGLPLPSHEDEDGFIEDNYIQPRDHPEEEEEDEGMYRL
ncbi:type III endosome membrane TEMP [Pelobates cultripes]|nr:type III endosome membrane TEMP [Pelobates cultripes]